LREGPSALTSRAVTTEAGVAKGVLHRHFADFDGFLLDLVLSRADGVKAQAAALLALSGTGTVAGNLSTALTDLFGPVAVAVVALIISRDELRARLRRAVPAGVPVLSEATAMVAAYLGAERDRGRLVPGVNTSTLAPMLIGATHLLFADRTSPPPKPAVVRRMVEMVLTGSLQGPPR